MQLSTLVQKLVEREQHSRGNVKLKKREIISFNIYFLFIDLQLHELAADIERKKQLKEKAE